MSGAPGRTVADLSHEERMNPPPCDRCGRELHEHQDVMLFCPAYLQYRPAAPVSPSGAPEGREAMHKLADAIEARFAHESEEYSYQRESMFPGVVGTVTSRKVDLYDVARFVRGYRAPVSPPAPEGGTDEGEDDATFLAQVATIPTLQDASRERLHRIGAALRAEREAGELFAEASRRQLAMYPQVGGGWVIEDDVPTGGGDADVVELARTRGTLADALRLALRRAPQEGGRNDG